NWEKQYVTEYYIKLVNLCHFYTMLTFMLQESVAADDIETALSAPSSRLSFFVGYNFYGANKTGREHKMPNESNAITWGQLWGNLPDRIFKCPYKVKR
ncbi:uncharacterized protein METZ01_LOCUS192926, partial [marine metagenome]